MSGLTAKVPAGMKPAARPSSVLPARSGLLQRKCACGGATGTHGECAECQQKELGLRRLATGVGPATAPPIVHDVLRSPGQPLDATARALMESRLGHDFSQVRIHTDRQAADSARSVDALAYTVGRDLVFGAGQYAPETNEGRRLLVHELAHVVQQGFGVPEPGRAIELGSRDGRELQAEAMAASLSAPATGGLVGSVGRANYSLQRAEDSVDNGSPVSSLVDAGPDSSTKSQSDCSAAQAAQVDLVKAAAVHFMRKVLVRMDPVPTTVRDCGAPAMPYTCDVPFSNGLVIEVEVSADHVRVFVSQADQEPDLVKHGPVCTFAYACPPSGTFKFTLTECLQ